MYLFLAIYVGMQWCNVPIVVTGSVGCELNGRDFCSTGMDQELRLKIKDHFFRWSARDNGGLDQRKDGWDIVIYLWFMGDISWSMVCGWYIISHAWDFTANQCQRHATGPAKMDRLVLLEAIWFLDVHHVVPLYPWLHIPPYYVSVVFFPVFFVFVFSLCFSSQYLIILNFPMKACL